MAVVIAKWLGPGGRVYATDIREAELAEIRAAVAREGLANVVVLEGATSSTKLPSECCDAIFMRDVYHHLTHPREIGASLMAALRPGGRLALMDFPPEPGSSIPAGVPGTEGGHGIPVSVIVSEMAQSGFRHVTTLSRWPPDDSRTRLFRVVEDPDGHILRFGSEPKEVRDDGPLSLEDPRYGVLLREKSSSGGSAAGQRHPCRPGEATCPEIRPAPLPIVVSALRAHTDARVLADNLPDLPSATA